MFIPIGSTPTGIAALRVYQQVKQHGEPTPSRTELQAKLDAEQALSTSGERVSTNQAVSKLTSEEQIQQQRELERAWGLMSAVLGTQLDEYA
ncbi:hypothetical protein H8K33_16840 [Undibacterium amnicola]|uniref:Uncharacterized protein n=1 Tax=Undibacterium amnicola TaxID=1834038 RepID=A0ABR6XUZ3_9BURK|nr:hypothetical protein [Undibacterium amnicola]MBC3833178.1 hypothetical protein [Undibacterium amnicola]